MRARLAAWTLLCLALGACTAAGERVPFNGAVHSDAGVEEVDDGMTEETGVHMTDRWISLQLYPGFFTPRSWQAPQYRLDGTYVRIRGWFTSKKHSPQGTTVFVLPKEAWPLRRETWKVTMKGTDRFLNIDTKGAAVLGDELHADTWVPLAGLAYNARSAIPELAELEDDDAQQPPKPLIPESTDKTSHTARASYKHKAGPGEPCGDANDAVGSESQQVEEASAEATPEGEAGDGGGGVAQDHHEEL